MRINCEVKNINILGKLSKPEIENQRVGFFFFSPEQISGIFSSIHVDFLLFPCEIQRRGEAGGGDRSH